MPYFAGEYDVAVIGAGHAGIEAALAAARMGCKTVIFAINLDSVGNMPCNPCIGGTAKGHLVREIDALGGEMAKAADKTLLQSRMLNRGKGPAVHSLRAQIDRRAYSDLMKQTLEAQEGLDLKQAEVVDIIPQEGEYPWQLVTRLSAAFSAKKVILATGTFLGGKIYVGEVNFSGGPDGMFAANELTSSLLALGLPLRRFKTGTPARIHRASLDFSKFELQEGDDPIIPFSYSTKEELKNRSVCHIAYTNHKTHEVIRNNLHRSPLFAGVIEGVGPRYCPSIEDKVVRFSDKPRHQMFIEPCGLNTDEMYIQGMSSSLPEDVQIAFYRTIEGFENAQLMRNAYAIEYDCVDPLALYPSLEFKGLSGLYGAGQFNGSSGYEEAAAQGLVAGINAARAVGGLEPIILPRSGSYIGTLIDDLVTKGCMDPYRMMTSRSEYRLLLRQENADERLMPIGRENGLISDAEWEAFLARKEQKEAEIQRLSSQSVPVSDELNDFLVSRETSPLSGGIRLSELLKRPQIDYASLAPFDKERPELESLIIEKVETEIKYAGYIQKQLAQVKELHRLEKMQIPKDLDYSKIDGLRLEAQEKLQKIRPVSIGQASGISGVTPADISVLIIRLGRGKEEN